MQDLIQDFRVALYASDFQQAERLALNQIALLGENPEWLNELGTLYAAIGRMSEALQFFDRAISAKPKYLEAILNGAIVLAELGFYDDATARFNTANAMEMENNNNNNPTSVNIGSDSSTKIAVHKHAISEIYNAMGASTLAIDFAKQTIATMPTCEDHLYLARLLVANNKLGDALLELEAARRLDPRNTEVHITSAQCYLLLHKNGDAKSALARAELLESQSCAGRAMHIALGLEQ